MPDTSARPHPQPGNRAVFFLSASVLALELVSTRLLSAVFHGNVAFLAITSAMLGISLGGVIVSLEFNRLDERQIQRLQTFSALCSSGAILGTALVFTGLMNRAPALAFPLAFSAVTLTVTLSSVCLTLQFKHARHRIGAVYFSDLAGACAGAVSGVLLLTYLDPLVALLAVGVMAGCAAIMFMQCAYPRVAGAAGLGLVLLIAAAAVTLRAWPIEFRFFNGRYDRLLFSKSNSFSTVTVGAHAQDPRTLWIEIDADANTPIVQFNGDFDALRKGRQYLPSLAYAISPRGSQTLIIGPGGGIDVLWALAYGSSVTGVEINPIIADTIMRKNFADFSGNLYAHPDVSLIVAEGRSFIGRTTERFDVIQLTLVDSFAAAAAGAFTLSENNLYTVEAFRDYFKNLKDGGLLSLTRWGHEGYRLLNIAQEATANIGLPPLIQRTVVMRDIYDQGVHNFLLKKGVFSLAELERIRAFARDNNYTIVAAPNLPAAGGLSAVLRTNDAQSRTRLFPIDTTPTTDDRPYFFNTIRLRDFWRPFVHNPLTGQTNDNRLLGVLAFTILFTSLLFWMPLRTRRRLRLQSRSDACYLAYFGAIGLGFMFLEMALIQKFILYLEHPIYSYSVVLVGVLLFSSLGSLSTSRRREPRRSLVHTVVIVAFLALAERVLLPVLIARTIGYPIAGKIALTLLATLPVSFFMGQAFPLGITVIHREAKEYLIPWLWAVNGAASVLASVVTVFLAMYFGFTTVFLAGSVCYLLAGLSMIQSPARRAAAAAPPVSVPTPGRS